MALTPDDVVTKQFQHVRFKDGFDPDEVDDFLDEIVIEWRKALEENVELKAKLAAYESGAAPEAAAPAAVEAPVPAPVAEVPAEPAPTGSATATAGIIELAQRLHDEHVAEGEAKRNALIAEAETEVARIRTEAEAKQREESARLERERNTLEARITELRNFERDYRSQLRGYIEGQLRELDEKSTSTDSTPVSAIGL
ncbi:MULTISPECIES: DivIVA domain-containing protein [unclassified Microbacterium]|jgi:DivIVA domain-containing protein|uniref:DivIVA domain-containing protein n=1 Tax=unclassified Microbacterium TaxID=2609290 RepID=UPI00040F41F5|nr:MULTISPECIES: DivIVA domain-containing protein [unclassified Microbacterium]PQZ60470.1 DivIVA domain-containing protein [Microbacterium sp. MYb43]PQZ81896.1 DivIVA domain-containing protein [Microbacterium sp. MYb40]PRB22159.1 DivIVA domain-containing protein [Microbacterium sp. MYb54]PRB31276.1 DivIVA domain-containing protein [Microbacterium sp. MYb50]PRB69885.1 DivIVA domain-containing protein [Microbacterium sp. MYb24]